MKPGCFITFEGIEGMGKSTHMAYLSQRLTAEGIPHLCTREPGGTPLAEAMRTILLTPTEETIFPETELLLLMAGRLQHWRERIQPALGQGTWVLCDRFLDASFAYQGGGGGLDHSVIEHLIAWIMPGVAPDHTLFFDAPWPVGRERIQGKPADRIEAKDDAFFERVQAVYQQRAHKEPERFECFDATWPMKRLHTQMDTWLATLLKAYRG